MNGTVADVSARDLDIGGPVNLHREDFLKWMQGFGGIDLSGVMRADKDFDLPGQWIDGGKYRPEYDLLKSVPGATAKDRRAFLLAPQPADSYKLNLQLENTVGAKTAPRVQELLGLAPATRRCQWPSVACCTAIRSGSASSSSSQRRASTSRRCGLCWRREPIRQHITDPPPSTWPC